MEAIRGFMRKRGLRAYRTTRDRAVMMRNGKFLAEFESRARPKDTPTQLATDARWPSHQVSQSLNAQLFATTGLSRICE